jgi:hypothetical protein
VSNCVAQPQRIAPVEFLKAGLHEKKPADAGGL